MSARRVVQGHDGPVEIDEASRRVTKTYFDLRHDVAAAMAKREFNCGSRFFHVLSGFEHLACPRMLACDLGAPPRVVMEYCRGEPLSTYLLRIGERDSRAADIAAKIHKGLRLYVEEFAEPYYDLSFQNLLYDEPTGILTFLDFGIPQRSPAAKTCSAPEASLGILIGWARYEMLRPSRLMCRRAGYTAVTQSLMAAFAGEVSREHVENMARAAFDRLAATGTTMRRSYYGVAGMLLGDRHPKPAA